MSQFGYSSKHLQWLSNAAKYLSIDKTINRANSDHAQQSSDRHITQPNELEELLLQVLEIVGLACWIEIETLNPNCIYYFGPFVNLEQAKDSQAIYIEDLTQENAICQRIEIKFCRPKSLTVELPEPTSKTL
jgi:hypothetical protein